MINSNKEINKINHLTPIKFCFIKNNRSFWLFKCDCGKKVIREKSSVITGHTKTCGCRMVPYDFKKLKNTRLFSIWRGMRDRCNLENKSNYKYYGGRGIKVCPEWDKNYTQAFLCFYKWAINNGYKDGMTIDRINNDKDYCPENCRWVYSKEQGENKRNNIIIEYNGEKHCITHWARIINKSRKFINNRLKKGIPFDKILKEASGLT